MFCTSRFGAVICFFATTMASAADHPMVDAYWQRSIVHDLSRLEYHASTASDGRLAAPNRAQDLRVTFSAAGIVVRPRTDERASFEWGLELKSIGRDGTLVRPEATKPAANGSRVEYHRGVLVEWYENDARGLEQGFTLASRPAGTGDLVLEFSVTGTLIATARDGGIDYASEDGATVLRYDHLVVVDANGHAIAARMDALQGVIRIAVADRDACYPLTVDPLASNPVWTADGNQYYAKFGEAVACAGDVNGDGYSDVVVGAEFFDHGESNEGRAFVYLGSAKGLGLAPAWIAESDQKGARFGASVANAGDVNGDPFSDVIVGASEFDDLHPNEGRAFVFLGAPPASSFIPGDRLHGSFAAPGDYTAAAFDGVAGMKLGLDFAATPSPMKIRLQLCLADGSVVKQLILQLGEKGLTKTLKLPTSGPFTLRWNLLNGTPGAFDITTSRTLPKPLKSKTLKPKPGKTTASLGVLALPGALLDVTLTKQEFAGTIGVSMTRPDNTAYDVTSYTTTAANGDIALEGVPCEWVGAYKLTVTGFANSEETVKAKVKLTQPAPGNADVNLP